MAKKEKSKKESAIENAILISVVGIVAAVVMPIMFFKDSKPAGAISGTFETACPIIGVVFLIYGAVLMWRAKKLPDEDSE